MSARHLRLVSESTPADHIVSKSKRLAMAKARREIADRMFILGSLEELLGDEAKVHAEVRVALALEARDVPIDPKTIDLLRDFVARLHLHASRYEREMKRLELGVAGGGC